MTRHPYQNLTDSAFWKTGVVQTPASPDRWVELVQSKQMIQPGARIASAGSCFAQHVATHLRRNTTNLLDCEPPPPGLAADQHHRFGYSLYSARYGNIYTVRQLRQLVEEVAGLHQPEGHLWRRGDHWIDGLRPSVEPIGLESEQEVVAHRRFHLQCVATMLEQLDWLVVTLGLTECWRHRPSGTVFPMAPGTQAGSFDPDLHELWISSHREAQEDLLSLRSSIERLRGGRPFELLLTVSPVPLTATASGQHVLSATLQAKATLLSVAQELAREQAGIHYFPSYEIIHHPNRRGSAFEANLRSIRADAVADVMEVFQRSYGPEPTETVAVDPNTPGADDLVCDEALLETFAG